MFIDTARINVMAGKGGKGVNSFYRDKFTRRGHPDGGDGGMGGDVVIRANINVHTLIDFQYRHIFKAGDGSHGSGKKKKGKDGKNLIIDVPAGTIIYDAGTNRPLKDLVKKDEEFIAAKGGIGGRGNRSHKDATPGEEGESKSLFLELKLIADIGIIGFPNVGKSTLLSRISKAHPKIAAYPFTTKNPILGVVEYDDITFRVAEIPGLIEDSHRGRGLGDKFLRHAERTSSYIHLLDLSKKDADEILSDYLKLNKELELYDKKLILKPQIIVGNKIDIEGAQENLKVLKRKLNKDIIAISAKEGTGLENLIKTLRTFLERGRDG